MDNTRTINPGTNRTIQINAAIRSAAARYVATGLKQEVVLGPGVHYLEAPIVGKSGVRLKGSGDRTVLVPTYTGAADDVANHVVGVEGTIDAATTNTTLAATAIKNVSSITLASAGNLAARGYLLIQGRNVPGEDALNESSGASVELSELVRAANTYAGGAVVALAWPLRQHHGTTGITVRACAPVVGFQLHDVCIEGSEDGVLTAVGIFARYAFDLEVHNVTISGCSRFAVDIVGCKDVVLVDFRSKGTVNGWLQLTSVIGARVTGLRGDQGVDRVHASGYPRYPILLRQRCTDVDVDDVHLTGVAAGMYIGGGEHIRVGSFEATDVYLTTTVYDRMVASGEIDNTAPIILGFGTGYGPLAIAEFAFDVTIGSIRTEDLRANYDAFWTASSPTRARAVYIHDILNGHIGHISAINRGQTSDQTLVSGVTISDVSGHINSIAVAGHIYGLTFENSANGVRIDHYTFKGGAGSSPNSTIPIFCTHITPSAQSIHLGRVSLSNASSAFRTGGSFVGDFRFRVDHLLTDGGEWTDCILGEITGDVQNGDVMEIDATATDNTRQKVIQTAAAVGYERRLAAIATGDDVAGASFVLICPLPARLATVKAAAGVITRGGVLKSSGAGTRTVEEDAAAAHPIGIARDYKAAGAGLIRIGLVNS